MTQPRAPVRVLIVDDSRTIRAMIRSVLDADSRFVVVGEAGDPYAARDLIKSHNPDVLTLDVEMPRMNGLVFLRNLMRLRPMPVVMVSTRTAEQSEDAVTALSLGAVDCIDLKRVHGAPDIRAKLTQTLLVAAGASLRKTQKGPTTSAPGRTAFQWSGKYVLIGSSTGGVEALETVFSDFPKNCPPTLVAQHMPAAFLQSFANRLNSNVAPSVQLAKTGEIPKPGNIYFAPGGDHHLVLQSGDVPRLRLVPDRGEQMYVPAVDVLFRSAVPMGKSVVSVILTGMGRDGSEAMLALRKAGAQTLAQDAQSAVIDGMPGAARANGSADGVYSIGRIGDELLKRSGTFERERA